MVGEDGSSPPGPCWDWDGNLDAPTITPSLLIQYDHSQPPEHRVCHSFIVAGQWQYLWRCYRCQRAFPHARLLAGHLVDVHGEAR